MKCLLCENFSFSHICKNCQEIFLAPSLYKRKISGVEVLSFYKYNEIKKLLHTKHTDLGYYIYKILAQNSFKKFAESFELPNPVVSIGVDDLPMSGGYSHTAIINKELKSSSIQPLYSKLRAQNRVSYSGKSREFRLLNSRNFQLKNFQAKELILVDDIVTTGATLTQAIQLMQQHNKEVLFCLTLANVEL